MQEWKDQSLTLPLIEHGRMPQDSQSPPRAADSEAIRTVEVDSSDPAQACDNPVLVYVGCHRVKRYEKPLRIPVLQG